MSRIRVLVVDDSAFARKVLTQMLAASPDIEVVDMARDGLDALEKIERLKPDVVTLDLIMPNLDGLGVMQALGNAPMPRVVVVSISDENSDLGIAALQRGAIDIVHKPTALATERLYDISDELVAKVIAAARAHPRSAEPVAHAPLSAAMPHPGRTKTDVVVVGTSTGGPQALTRLVADLPGNFPVPIAIALHIPAGYTEPLARRLSDAAALHVVQAFDGLELRPGLVALAPGGTHLVLERSGSSARARIHQPSSSSGYRPSVDLLFESAARSFNERVLGVVLTGMGDDGLAGARAIRAAGGMLLTEAESSCVVYGMPRCVKEAHLAQAEAPLERMAEAIVERA